MKKKQTVYTVLSSLLIIVALLLPIMATGSATMSLEHIGTTDPTGEEHLLFAFFVAAAVSARVLIALFVSCAISCVMAGIAIHCASSALTMARAEARSTILPRILHITAIVETAVAVLFLLIPLVLLSGVLTM